VRVDENVLLDGGGSAATEPPPNLELQGPNRTVQYMTHVALGDGLAAGREAEGQNLGLKLAPARVGSI